ncbi:MAG: bifunctional hydroxymethylpyrimidine kinase/phosphomethylpyrimidine kinase [Peptoniphilaceae bacterium]|nr:bifunctional hydroxymethylpyrimidine kinase/phosphomethylpyrimidine kinase [Peptoniphilaceae bacterium]MDY6018202.1 bifunctional hydroxymethylpyrimidine kinase/phosphomethylpyrimidine kinase [Anaerococcus sp.]
MKKILIINDFVSWGKIAGSQVDTILTYKGYDVIFLPTALISNIFSKGGFSDFDTSPYIKESLDRWKDLGVKFDAVFVGYLKNSRQKDLIMTYLQSLDQKPLVIHDPIMADKGTLYKGLDPSIIDVHRDFSKISDISIPNFTEAKFISQSKSEDPLTIAKIIGENNKKVIITSVNDENSHNILAYNGKEAEKISYDYIDKSFAGTGDIFDGLFLEAYLKTYDFRLSIIKAKDTISKILKTKVASDEKSIDIKIEKYLNLL